MKRILTGIQATGIPHLGNLFGAIIPAIELSNSIENESFLFIADMHSLTRIKNKEEIKENTYAVAASWLAFGLDTNKSVFYKQSDLPETCELTWYLNCFFPYQKLTLAHSFKDKLSRLKDLNNGLFSYPMLMAADILLYDANIVPVGKDQIQHIEMTRNVAQRFNHKMGECFVIPEVKLSKKTMLVKGIDGEKMSKSRNNIIDIFLPEKELKKNINKIITDSTPLEEPKDYNICNVFQIYQILADAYQIEDMKMRYQKGGLGYGDVKKEILEIILEKYKEPRRIYFNLMNNKHQIDEILKEGSIKARKTARDVLNRVRNLVGFQAQ